MRVGLHWKILVASVLPLLGLTAGALWTVNRNISSQAQRNIREDLVRAASIFEDMLTSRAEELAIAGQVIVEDPKFFSVLTLPVSGRDPQLRATAEGVAEDFDAITQADLFLTFDSQGNLVADASQVRLTRREWRSLIQPALTGRPYSFILVDADRHFQVTITPVRAGQRLIGALLLGAGIDQGLAERLRSLTRSEVTFLSAGVVTGSTLERSEDRQAIAASLSHRPNGSFPPEGLVFDFDGSRSRYVSIAREIRGSAPGQGQLYIMQRSLEAETAFLAPMRATLIEIGFFVMIMSVGVGYIISRGVTAPVRTLVRAAEEMERGNYDSPLEVRSRDEIGYLAQRFRDMRQRQRSYVKSLEEVARLKGDFIDVASHELRTPLSILKGFLELLLLERLGPVSPNQREALTAMERGVGTLTRIAEDASRLAQIQSERLVLSPGVHDVASLLADAVKRAHAAGSGRHVAVRLDVPWDLPPATLDGSRLTDAVYHLVCNGIRFTQDGGTVTLDATREGEYLVIQVRDTGAGIEPEKLTRLLDRSIVIRDSRNHHSSSTLEFNSAGLGLGIPIVRGVAEAHGGTLTARSSRGSGSVFILRLPASWGAAGKAAA